MICILRNIVEFTSSPPQDVIFNHLWLHSDICHCGHPPGLRGKEDVLCPTKQSAQFYNNARRTFCAQRTSLPYLAVIAPACREQSELPAGSGHLHGLCAGASCDFQPGRPLPWVPGRSLPWILPLVCGGRRPLPKQSALICHCARQGFALGNPC